MSRRRRFRRWVVRPFIWALALAALAALGVGLALRSELLRERGRALLMAQLREVLARDVRVGGMRLELVPLSLELRDVVVPGDSPDDPAFAEIDRILIEGDFRGLRRPVLRLRTVLVERPRIHILLREDGTDNVPRLRTRGGGRRRLEVKIDALTVSDGALELGERRLPLDLRARAVQARLLGAADQLLAGDVVAQEVEITLPEARPYPFTFAARAEIDRGRVRITRGRIASPELRGRVEGAVGWGTEQVARFHAEAEGTSDLFVRLGYIDEQEPQASGPFSLRGDFTWTPELWSYEADVDSAGLTLLGRPLTELRGHLTGDRERLLFALDRAGYHGGQVKGLLSVDVAAQARDVALDLAFEGVDAVGLLADQEIPVEAVSARVRGTFNYRFPFRDPEAGSGAADLRVLAGPPAAGRLALSGTVPLRIERGVVRAETIRLSAPGQEITASGSYDIEDGRGRFEWTIETENAAPLVVLLPPPPPGEPEPLWLPSAGAGVIAATLHLGPEGPSADVQLALAGVRSAGLTAESALGSLRVNERWVEGLDVRFTRPSGELAVSGRIPLADESGRAPAAGLDVRVAARGWPLGEARPWLPEELVDLPLGGSFTGDLVLQGDLEAPSGRVEGELARASYGGVELGLLRAAIEFDPQRVAVRSADLESGAGAVTAAGELGLRDERLDFTISAPSLALGAPPLSDYLSSGLTGLLALDAELRGTLDRPAGEAALRARDLALHGRPLGSDGSAEVSATWDGAQLAVSGSLLGLAEVEGGGALDLERADLRFAVRSSSLREIVEAAAGRALPELAGGFSGELRIAGAFAPGAPLTAALTADPLEATYSGHALRNREPIRVRLEGQTVVVDSFYLVEPGTDSEVFVGGRVGLGEGAALDLQMQASLAARWLELVAPALQMTGTFDALATVRGTLEQPRISGQGGVSGARLLLLGFPHAFEAIDATLLFYADAVVLDRLASRLGGGALQASGRIELPAEDRGLSYRIQATARNVTLRYPEGWLVRGDGDLLLASVPGGRQVSGSIALDRAYYLRDVRLGFTQLLRAALAQERVEVAATDELMITTQLNLALAVPPGALRVSNNLADLRGRADLSVRGTLANPVVFGRVEMEAGGKVVYAESEYKVERAVLTFANPYRIEPFVDLVATTKVSSYQVTLNLAGPLDRLNATFASDPPIADLEVLSLLATGEPDRLAGDLAARRESSVGAESFLAQQAASLIGQRVGTLFGLDRFRVAPITAGESGISSVRLTVAKRLSRDVLVTYSFDPSVTEDQFLTVEWQMSPTLALVLTQNGDGSYAVDARWEKAF